MRFVTLKSQDQLDLQSLHRVRDRPVGARTVLIDQLRAILLDRGLIAPQRRRKLELRLDEWLGREKLAVILRVRALIEDMRSEWRALDHRIDALDGEFAVRARTDNDA